MLAIGLGASALGVPNASFVQTPNGPIHESCVFRAGMNGELSDNKGNKWDTVLAAPSSCQRNGTASLIPDVTTYRQTYAMAVQTEKQGGYWKQMTADWVVPPIPSEDQEQVVYFWPGFKSGAPVMGRPVLQPVMQYGQDDSKTWQLQSWFVHETAVTGVAIPLLPGDRITSSMHFNTSTQLWTVKGTNLRSGESSVLSVSKSLLGGYDFEWAMLVCETIKRDGDCDSLPATTAGLTFSKVSVDGVAQSLDWEPVVGLQDCHEGIDVSKKSGDVLMSWSPAGHKAIDRKQDQEEPAPAMAPASTGNLTGELGIAPMAGTVGGASNSSQLPSDAMGSREGLVPHEAMSVGKGDKGNKGARDEHHVLLQPRH